ncbi:MAG: hypothetical protein LC775_12060, partial [Acidobacteria bacterium]|nr:hypothetical protein [Acidobacteriota bacterium]
APRHVSGTGRGPSIASCADGPNTLIPLPPTCRRSDRASAPMKALDQEGGSPSQANVAGL